MDLRRLISVARIDWTSAFGAVDKVETMPAIACGYRTREPQASRVACPSTPALLQKKKPQLGIIVNVKAVLPEVAAGAI